MKWGINVNKYLSCDALCRYYGSKQCPCVLDKTVKAQYDTKDGPWANGRPLPECADCKEFVQIHPNDPIPTSFRHTLVESAIWLAQYNHEQEEKRENKRKEKEDATTPVYVELLSANGGTANERASKMIIGGMLLGAPGVLLGLLGKNRSNVTLVFKVLYADGQTKIVTEKANSKEAERLLALVVTK